jgi:hypothetical protein
VSDTGGLKQGLRVRGMCTIDGLLEYTNKPDRFLGSRNRVARRRCVCGLDRLGWVGMDGCFIGS